MQKGIQRQNNEVFCDEHVIMPTTGGLRLACKLWTVKGKKASDHAVKLICYPGWLDNSGSFDAPAELLCRDYGFALLAIDPPGCGFSDHRPATALYVDYEEPPLIADVADEMGWEHFGLLGHSRGGGVCALAAGLLGNRIKGFVCIDSYFSLSGMWFEDLKQPRPLAVNRMKRAREMAKKNLVRQTRVFSTFQEAVEANMNNPWFKKSETTARNIVRRHLRPCAGGYTFTHDTRTYGQIAWVHLTKESLEDFLMCITSPILQVLDGSRWKTLTRNDKVLLDKMASNSKSIKSPIHVVNFDGKGHHMHSDVPREFADLAGPWLNEVWNKPAGACAFASPSAPNVVVDTQARL